MPQALQWLVKMFLCLTNDCVSWDPRFGHLVVTDRFCRLQDRANRVFKMSTISRVFGLQLWNLAALLKLASEVLGLSPGSRTVLLHNLPWFSKDIFPTRSHREPLPFRSRSGQTGSDRTGPDRIGRIAYGTKRISVRPTLGVPPALEPRFFFSAFSFSSSSIISRSIRVMSVLHRRCSSWNVQRAKEDKLAEEMARHFNNHFKKQLNFPNLFKVLGTRTVHSRWMFITRKGNACLTEVVLLQMRTWKDSSLCA